MQNSNSNIKVSVCVVTYNQEKYIGECLESLVTQKTDFPFEIIVGDDASTDNTPNIIQEYQQKYPDIIIPILRQENLGPVGNIVDIYKRAKGKYIAHLDGDDMALPGKLQIQADTLDSNPDCSICAHRMYAVEEKSGKIKRILSKFEKKKFQLIDLYLINPFIIHSSKMFINQINDYINKVDSQTLDLELHIFQAYQGNIYMIDKVLGKYREFTGITYQNSTINPLIPQRIQYLYSQIDITIFNRKEINKIHKKYAHILLQYANHYILRNNFPEAKRFVIKSGKTKKSLNYFLFRLGILFPSLFQFILKKRKKNE